MSTEIPGSLLSYGTSDGYIDGFVRGYQLGLLTRSDYEALTQCDSLEDMKLHLQGIPAYGDFLNAEPSPLHTTTIAEKCTGKLVEEFEYLRVNATGPLSKFLDYITYGYMIDNIVLLITGSLHKRDIAELIEKCHPLGVFETMESIVAGQNVSELYHEVLCDTPLGPYIVENLSEADLDEMNVEEIRNTLYKAYLEDFDAFCENLGGITAMVMHEILQFEADRRSINITLNSFDTDLTQDSRSKLYPKLGLLYPEGRNKLAVADKPDDVKSAVEHVEVYKKIFADIEGKEDKSLEDVFFEFEVQLNLKSFEQMFQYGVFFSYIRLKEQEIRNIVWIAECILQNHRTEIDHYILPSFR